MPPGRLPVGTGGDEGPSEPQPVGVGAGSVPNGIWYHVSSSIFSLWPHLLRPQRDHNELPKRNNPNRPKYKRTYDQRGQRGSQRQGEREVAEEQER